MMDGGDPPHPGTPGGLYISQVYDGTLTMLPDTTGDGRRGTAPDYTVSRTRITWKQDLVNRDSEWTRPHAER